MEVGFTIENLIMPYQSQQWLISLLKLVVEGAIYHTKLTMHYQSQQRLQMDCTILSQQCWFAYIYISKWNSPSRFPLSWYVESKSLRCRPTYVEKQILIQCASVCVTAGSFGNASLSMRVLTRFQRNLVCWIDENMVCIFTKIEFHRAYSTHYLLTSEDWFLKIWRFFSNIRVSEDLFSNIRVSRFQKSGVHNNVINTYPDFWLNQSSYFYSVLGT